jgi:K319L-like, PKD domain
MFNRYARISSSGNNATTKTSTTATTDPPPPPQPPATTPVSNLNNPNQCLSSGRTPDVVANAGLDQTVHSGDTVTLDGSASIGGVYYNWLPPSNLPRLPSPLPSMAKVTFTAPQVTTKSVYTFQLFLTDSEARCSSDYVDVTVEPPVTSSYSITVVTNVINDNGGTKRPEDFTITAPPGFLPTEFQGKSAPGTIIKWGSNSVPKSVLPKLYGDHAYYATYSNDCYYAGAIREGLTCTITINDDPHLHVLVLGDSVAWGQGLYQQQKFSDLVVKRIMSVTPHLQINDSDVQVWAHSGAPIGLSYDNHCKPTPNVYNDCRKHGEIPATFPTILQQIGEYVGDPSKVHLILLTACSDDVGAANNVSNANFPTSTIHQLAEEYCHRDMVTLLKCISPKTNIDEAKPLLSLIACDWKTLLRVCSTDYKIGKYDHVKTNWNAFYNVLFLNYFSSMENRFKL